LKIGCRIDGGIFDANNPLDPHYVNDPKFILRYIHVEKVKEVKPRVPREWYAVVGRPGNSNEMFVNKCLADTIAIEENRAVIKVREVVEDKEETKKNDIADIGILAFPKHLIIWEEAFDKKATQVFYSLEEFREKIPLEKRTNIFNQLTVLR